MTKQNTPANNNNNNNNPKLSRRAKIRARKETANRVMAPASQNLSSKQGGIFSQRYRESERIGSINGSVAFALSNTIQLNPGLAASFPWLSGHAALFEKYKVHKLIFRYKNLKGTSSSGNVIMSFDYDILDPAPASATEMCQSTKWIDGAPWRIFELKVPTDGRVLFTRSGNVAQVDLKTYDMGKLLIATEGCADTSTHGYLEVEYDIELMYKQSSSVSTNLSPITVLSIQTANPSSVGYIVFDNYINNPLGVTNHATAGRYILPAGWYRVCWELGCNNNGANLISVSVDVNGVAASPQNLKKSLSEPTVAPAGYISLSMSHVVNSTGSTDIGLYSLALRDALSVNYNRMFIIKL